MGHWSESLVEEVMKQLGDTAERSAVQDALARVGKEIDVLAGRSFHPVRRATAEIEANGLPFVDIPDLRVGTLETADNAWVVPDPVNDEIATVLQVLPLNTTVPKAAPTADALWLAGQLVSQAAQAGRLSADYIWHRVNVSVEREQRAALFRRIMDPAVRFYVPIFGISLGGWWFQAARRIIWVTDNAEDDGRLIEPLVHESKDGQAFLPLAAVEAMLIAAPMTRQPAEWAFAARIWPEQVNQPADRPWSRFARAIHGHGVPTITIDRDSTPYEVACQVVLKGYWHGYVKSDDPALADAVAKAYPQQVDQIQRKNQASSRSAAAATLLEQLIHPGFNPAQGAEATRRYVRRKASIAVREYRKREAPERYPWTQVGVSERRYYKLLPLFAQKVNGRYEYDYGDVVARMKAHLDSVDQERNVRKIALEVLQSHGFNDEAARKWLQRHPPESAVDAWPRGRRPLDG